MDESYHIKSDFLNSLQERGYIYDCTNIEGLDEVLLKNKHIVGYIGFDCTAENLHIGSLIQIMIIRNLQKFGYKPIVLLGGATTKIGDPSGKDKVRSILSVEDIGKNIIGIKKTLEQFISFGEGKSDAIIVNNADWFDELGYIDFLRSIGAHFSVNRMLTFDSVKNRLEREQNLSFLEFNYLLLQAYDFVKLNKCYGCTLQVGGSDQWGNIVSGVDLGQKIDIPGLFGLTTPLLLNSQGRKMGKTEKGAVWLDSQSLKPYEYWQYFRNIEDRDVGRFLKLFTDLSMSEIQKLESLQDKEINEAKKILATEVTKICHGNEEAEYAKLKAISTFEDKDNVLLDNFTLTKEQIVNGITLKDLLCNTNLQESKSKSKHLISSGGCKINDSTVYNENYVVSLKDFGDKQFIKLSSGTKHHVKVILI